MINSYHVYMHWQLQLESLVISYTMPPDIQLACNSNGTSVDCRMLSVLLVKYIAFRFAILFRFAIPFRFVIPCMLIKHDPI